MNLDTSTCFYFFLNNADGKSYALTNERQLYFFPAWAPTDSKPCSQEVTKPRFSKGSRAILNWILRYASHVLYCIVLYHRFDLVSSLNREKRKRELLRITHDNQEILIRIQLRQPEYDHRKWLEDWERNQDFMDNISHYPREWWLKVWFINWVTGSIYGVHKCSSLTVFLNVSLDAQWTGTDPGSGESGYIIQSSSKMFFKIKNFSLFPIRGGSGQVSPLGFSAAPCSWQSALSLVLK
jgi:hypothetical protein